MHDRHLRVLFVYPQISIYVYCQGYETDIYLYKKIKNKNVIMYDNNEYEDQTNEGWIALGICAIIGICIMVVLWEPDVEAIGS